MADQKLAYGEKRNKTGLHAAERWADTFKMCPRKIGADRLRYALLILPLGKTVLETCMLTT